MPKKLFVHAAHFAEALEDSVGFGWSTEGIRFDWPTLRDNVNRDTEWLSGVYVRNLEKSGAELIRSRAILEDAHHIRLVKEDRVVSANYVLVATGGSPAIDRAIVGIEHAITSNEVFHLAALPKRLLVFGGGYIAVEFAGIFNAFGVETTLLHRGDDILRGFDGDIRKHVHAGMERRGITITTGDIIATIEKPAGAVTAVTRDGSRIEVEQILFATGRVPNTAGFGLERAGSRPGPTGR